VQHGYRCLGLVADIQEEGAGAMHIYDRMQADSTDAMERMGPQDR
jgi:hypothetical protein